jgi:hypothetical protein
MDASLAHPAACIVLVFLFGYALGAAPISQAEAIPTGYAISRVPFEHACQSTAQTSARIGPFRLLGGETIFGADGSVEFSLADAALPAKILGVGLVEAGTGRECGNASVVRLKGDKPAKYVVRASGCGVGARGERTYNVTVDYDQALGASAPTRASGTVTSC